APAQLIAPTRAAPGGRGRHAAIPPGRQQPRSSAGGRQSVCWPALSPLAATASRPRVVPCAVARDVRGRWPSARRAPSRKESVCLAPGLGSGRSLLLHPPVRYTLGGADDRGMGLGASVVC